MSPISKPLTDLPGPTTRSKPPRQGGARLHSHGLVARFSPIKGRTPKSVLKKRIWLPAILNTVTLTESALHNEYDTLSDGQFSQPAQGSPSTVTQLPDLPLDSLTLAWTPQWLVVTGQHSLDVRRALHRILRSRAPVHLLVYFHPHPDGTPEFDMNVTFRQQTRELRPGEHDTHYLSFTLKMWRDARIPRHSSRSRDSNTSRHKGSALPTSAKLTADDSLQSLSRDYYGTYSHWRLIRDANGISKRWGQKTPLVKIPNRFHVGSKIKIPALPSGGAALGA